MAGQQRARTEQHQQGETDGDDRRQAAHLLRGLVHAFARTRRHVGEPLPRVHALEQEAANPRAAADHQIAHVAVVDAAQRLRVGPGAAKSAGMDDDRRPTGDERARSRDATRQQQADALEQVEHERDR